MCQAFFPDQNNEGDSYRFFYVIDDFYFSATVDSEFPFRSPGRTRGNVAYAGDFKQGLEYWSRLMLQKKPGELATFSQTVNRPGHYHPRIWKGEMENLDSATLAGSRAILSKSVIAGDLIVARLYELFKYIEPIKANQIVHSHKIRELLLLSCVLAP